MKKQLSWSFGDFSGLEWEYVVKFKIYMAVKYIWNYRESVAGSVIQATGTVEFEDEDRSKRFKFVKYFYLIKVNP